MTFLVKESTLVHQLLGDAAIFEAFAVCRHCKKATIFKIDGHPQRYPHTYDIPAKANVRPVTVLDRSARPAPAHVPPDIKSAFEEGTKCFAVGCFNAAASMFRLVVDLATVGLLPNEDVEPPNERTRRSLGLRLGWLFDNGKLPDRLKDLADVVKDDGNDGAHRGTVDQATAEQLVAFTKLLLADRYTVPKEINLAKERRANRGAERGKSATSHSTST